MGQRESLLSAGGNRKNDDAKYRRTDVTVRVARSTQDEMPTKVVRRYQRSTKSKFWYVSTGVSGSVTAVAGFGFFPHQAPELERATKPAVRSAR